MREPWSPVRCRRAGSLLAVLCLIDVQIWTAPVRSTAQDAAATGPGISHLFDSGSTTVGGRISLRVHLTVPAGSEGARVVLLSSSPDVVPLPDVVTVDPDQTDKTFTVVTNLVSAVVVVKLDASLGGRTRGRQVLLRAPILRALHVQSVIRGGGLGMLTVCLTGIATPVGIVVSLTDADASALNVPDSITTNFGAVSLTREIIVQNVDPPPVAISIHDFTFAAGLSSPVSISVGDTVRWTNDDVTTHPVTADAGTFDSGDIPPGSALSFTFTEAGTLTYHCDIHRRMTASIATA